METAQLCQLGMMINNNEMLQMIRHVVTTTK